MKNSFSFGPAWAALLIFASCGPVSAEDPTIGRLLASQCAQCHGTNGHAVGNMDSLAGDQDLLEDLLDMIYEDHIEDIMEHQAHGYTPDQLRRIAEYYASLPEPGEGEEDGAEEQEDEQEEE